MFFKNILSFSLILTINLHALENKDADYSFKASGDVQDMVYKKNHLYVATSEGFVDIFDTKTKSLQGQIKIDPTKDFMGDDVASKIYSVDMIHNSILIVSQGLHGYRDIWLYKNDKLHKIIDHKRKLYIKKARFLDDDLIILATLSNEVIKYSLLKNQVIYKKQISLSSFSDFTLSEDLKKIVTTDESGSVYSYSVVDGILIKKEDEINLDKVYQLDYKNGIIITAGQDRRSVIYTKNSNSFLSFDFLLYSCALSPSGKFGAIAYNQNNEVLVFETVSKRKLYNLQNNDAILTKILFINKNEIYTSSNSNKINYYKLK